MLTHLSSEIYHELLLYMIYTAIWLLTVNSSVLMISKHLPLFFVCEISSMCMPASRRPGMWRRWRYIRQRVQSEVWRCNTEMQRRMWQMLSIRIYSRYWWVAVMWGWVCNRSLQHALCKMQADEVRRPSTCDMFGTKQPGFDVLLG